MAHETLFKIYIPEPCFEDWDKMTPNEQGAYCKVCSKTVVDFSGKSDDDIQKFLLANIDKKVCGRFKTSQIEENEPEIPKLKINIEEKKYSFPSFLFPLNTQFRRAALALMLSAGAMMYGCNSGGNAGGDDNRLTGAVELKDDTLKTINDTTQYNDLNRIQGGISIKDAQRLNYLQDSSKTCEPNDTRTVGKIRVEPKIDTVKADSTETMLKGEIAPRKMGMIKKVDEDK